MMITNKPKLMKKLVYLVLIMVVLLVIWFVKFAFFPTGYRDTDWMEPFDRHLRQFDFANYELPQDYEMVTYRWSHTTEYNKLLVYKHKISRQLLILVLFREHPKADFSEVRFSVGTVKQPFWSAERDPVRGNFFAIWHYLPFGWRDDFENAGQDVTIRGIEVDQKETFSTEKTDVLYVKGEFDRLGFYKRSDNWRPYVTPVLDFTAPREGVLAVINDKKTGKTLFAVGCNYLNADFNEAQFRKIIESLDLDATPLSEAFSHIKGLKKKITVTRP